MISDICIRLEKYIRVSFWGLNGGLALMVITNLFPGGVLQFVDVLNNGYWHARSSEFLRTGFMLRIEWLRLPADLIFITLDVMLLLFLTGLRFISLRKANIR